MAVGQVWHSHGPWSLQGGGHGCRSGVAQPWPLEPAGWGVWLQVRCGTAMALGACRVGGMVAGQVWRSHGPWSLQGGGYGRRSGVAVTALGACRVGCVAADQV